MRLAIADPPYPPFVGAGGTKRRASRWYGPGVAASDHQADFHEDAAAWDDPERHRALLTELEAYDGWAIATSPDGLSVYLPRPAACRVLVWVKTNAQPGSHRIRTSWEAVIVLPPDARRSNRGVGQVPDVLTCSAPTGLGFVGAKPRAWVTWVLDALGYDEGLDSVADLFPGSGAVSAAIAQTRLPRLRVSLLT